MIKEECTSVIGYNKCSNCPKKVINKVNICPNFKARDNTRDCLSGVTDMREDDSAFNKRFDMAIEALEQRTDERSSFYHDAYNYVPQIDTKDFLLNDMHTHIFSKWFDDDESEDEE